MNQACLVVLALAPAVTFSSPQEPAAEPSEKVAVVDTLSAKLAGGAGGLAVDKDGVVYCADFGSALGFGSKGGDKVYAIDPQTGAAKKFVGGLRGASGNAIGPDGSFYQSNIGMNSITRVKPDGTSSYYLREGLRSPVGIVVDKAGNLYVANCGSASIVKVAPDGKGTKFVANRHLSCPNGITMDDDGILYVSNFNNGDVMKIDKEANVSKLATLPGNNNGHLAFHQGSIYVVARGAHQIYKVELDGEYALFAGSGERGAKNGPALEASFSFPNDLAFSPDGKFLYVNENASLTEPHTVLAPMNVRRIRLAE